MHSLKDFISLSKGSIVTLNDESSIWRSKKYKLGLNGMQYTVKRVIEFTESEDLMRFYFAEIEHALETRWLMVKVVDDDFDVRVLFEPTDYESGNRRDLVIDRDIKWMFKEPDTDEIVLNNLVYTESFDWDKVVYNKKRQADINGESQERPKPSGFSKQLATLAEYCCDGSVKADNPQALLLEIGPAESDDGGLLRLFLGYVIPTSEVEILNLK